uniref:Uncharacterized protein n=1 Tax=Tetranychus urticae TaxID=32264 RepID=T1K4Q3_TETUR
MELRDLIGITSSNFDLLRVSTLTSLPVRINGFLPSEDVPLNFPLPGEPLVPLIKLPEPSESSLEMNHSSSYEVWTMQYQKRKIVYFDLIHWLIHRRKNHQLFPKPICDLQKL